MSHRVLQVVVPRAGASLRYDVLVGQGALHHLPDVLTQVGLSRSRLAVITDTNVAVHYLEPVVAMLESAGFDVVTAVMPAGEAHKTLSTVQTLASSLASAGLDRTGAVLALGGGVVGDVAGFVAATFMRGVPVVQCPTSLLAMVDSSIGGKTGVDLEEGKNLVGAFHHPKAVVADPDVLRTLHVDEFRSGSAELIKHAILDESGALFTKLSAEPLSLATVGDVLADAMRVKVEVVSEDPTEHGRRALLNLGHTFGHALERVRDYGIRHGEAVAIGTVAAVRYGELAGMTVPTLRPKVAAMLVAHGLPIVDESLDESAVEDLLSAMMTDKKKAHGKLRLVVPRGLGDVMLVEDVDQDALRASVTGMVAEPPDGA